MNLRCKFFLMLYSAFSFIDRSFIHDKFESDNDKFNYGFIITIELDVLEIDLHLL